jgi:ribosomal protein L11 methyltransferase
MRVLVLTVPTQLCELISDRLWGLGVVAIEERLPDQDPAAAPNPTTPTEVELWTSLGEDGDQIAAALSEIGFHATPGVQPGTDLWWRWEEVSEQAVNSWREFTQPFVIADQVLVVPEWLADQPVHASSANRLMVRIDPGSAFGMGDHPTTALSLELVLRVLQPGDHVLDVGCGSGILGIVAALAGAGKVTANDISLAAIEATKANATRNNVVDRIEVSLTPLADLANRLAAGEAAQPAIVVANILAPALIALAPDLRRSCAPNGRIIVSGLLEDNCAHVIAALTPWRVVDQISRDGWTAVMFAT